MSDTDTGLPVEAIAEYLCCDDMELLIRRVKDIQNMATDFLRAARLEAAGGMDNIDRASSMREKWYDRA